MLNLGVTEARGSSLICATVHPGLRTCMAGPDSSRGSASASAAVTAGAMAARTPPETVPTSRRSISSSRSGRSRFTPCVYEDAV